MAPGNLTSVTLVHIFVLLLSFHIALGAVLPDQPLKLYRGLLSEREPPRALAQDATPEELKWQPAFDFDTDSCYNTPAIGPDGKPAEGLEGKHVGVIDWCRDESDLDNNNVYVRTRCNNGWCAHVYDYYFEKDVANTLFVSFGHRHEWEHIIVFVQNDQAKIVAVSEHGEYDTRDADKIRWEGETHPKVVYHKAGLLTHCFRFAHPDDDAIENHKHVWFRGALVNWEGLKTAGVLDALVNHNFGKASMATKDKNFKTQIDLARNNGDPEFDSGIDA